MSKAALSTKVDGEYGTHSVSEEEHRAFVEHINALLEGDELLSDRLPMDSNSQVQSS